MFFDIITIVMIYCVLPFLVVFTTTHSFFEKIYLCAFIIKKRKAGCHNIIIIEPPLLTIPWLKNEFNAYSDKETSEINFLRINLEDKDIKNLTTAEIFLKVLIDS